MINQKDLPRIYSMMVPRALGDTATAPVSSFLREALPELERTRNEIIAEVHRAPSRRIDNVTTHLHDSALLLRMHAIVLNAVQKEYTRAGVTNAVLSATATFAVAALSGAAAMSGMVTVAAPLGVGALIIAGAIPSLIAPWNVLARG